MLSESSEPIADEAPRRRGRPRKTALERDSGNRRQDLIAGAAKLFRKQGFAATSTRDIAAAASMQSGSPFYFFDNKEELLQAVMQEGMERAIASQDAVLDLLLNGELETSKRRRHIAKNAENERFEQPLMVLRGLIRHHFEVLLGPRSDFIPVMLYEWRSLAPKQRAQIAKLQARYEERWQPVFEALHQQGALRGDLKLARLLIFGALNWSAQWWRPRGGASLDDLTQAALDLFITPK